MFVAYILLLLHDLYLGWIDYLTPLELLLEGVIEEFISSPNVLTPSSIVEEQSADRFSELGSKRGDNALFETIGYKAMLYIQYCFQGKCFPSGRSLSKKRAKDLAEK